MFQHHSEDSQNSYDPSGDTLGDVFESSHNSTLSCPPESNEPVPIPSEKELRQPNHDARGPQEEEGQELSSNGQYTNPYFLPLTSIAALLVHALLLVLSWTFFVITLTKPVPLSVKNAMKAQRHMQSVTMVVALIATGISLLSTTLYSLAIQRALALLLSTKLSLYQLYLGYNIAKPSSIINIKRPVWMIASIVCVVAVSAQTAGYSILLTPGTITVQSDMFGYELNLKSPDFQKLMQTTVQLSDKINIADMFTRALLVVASSGDTAVSATFSLPGIFTFNHFFYLNSTMGTSPVIVDETDSKILSQYGIAMPINVKVDKKWEALPGFPTSFSMIQQGFTAQVTCQQLGTNDSLYPTIIVPVGTVNSFLTPFSVMQVVCPNSTEPSQSDGVPWIPSTSASDDVDAVFAVSCPVNETDGRRKWDLILMGAGRYRNINATVCSIRPQVHTVVIDYNDRLFNSSSPKFINGRDISDVVDSPWLGDFALSVFLQGLSAGQSTTGNAMGDIILFFMSTLPNKDDILNDILSQYVRGVLELSGTLLRTVYTLNGNGLYPGNTSDIPKSMQVPITGTYSASTVGWHQASETAFASLAAPTIVSLITILIVVFTLVTKGRAKEPDANHYFNPCDVLHIISAASAGGMQKNFPPFHENNVEHCENTMITLAPVEGDNGRSGFIDLN